MTNLADALVGAWQLERWTIDYIGTTQVRSVSLDGDALMLGAEETLESPGRVRRHRICWRRATDVRG